MENKAHLTLDGLEELKIIKPLPKVPSCISKGQGSPTEGTLVLTQGAGERNEQRKGLRLDL